MMSTKFLPGRRSFALLCGFALLVPAAFANNLSISGVTLTDRGGGQADIQFSMSWDHSWHESWTESGGAIQVTNWDAVWVFAKYRQNGGLWKHVRLTAADHTATGGTVIEVPDDGGGQRPGALVYRAANGTGTVNCQDMRLRWDLAAQGLPSSADIDLTVLGVEMVYIPEGAFYLGSGGAEVNHFYQEPDQATPYLVASEAEIAVGGEAGNLNGAEVLAGTLPAAYPKGFAAFYCMKYEITEGQYVDFLNLIDPGKVAPFFPNQAGNWRHTIAAAAGGGYESAAPDRACGYLGAVRAAAYLDWAGLRPMSELEFEKACRGVRQPWVDEFVWGNTTLVPLTGLLGADGSGTETADPPAANAHSQQTIAGPVRAGIFATASTTREGAGASYYGVMDLGGNLWEFTVNTRDQAGSRSFDGTHGDGDEYTDPFLVWPGSTYWHYAGRGGAYDAGGDIGRLRTSARHGAVGVHSSAVHNVGARGVRTAP